MADQNDDQVAEKSEESQEKHWAERRLGEVSEAKNQLKDENQRLKEALAERDTHISTIESKIDAILAAQQINPTVHGQVALQEMQEMQAPDPEQDPEGYNQYWAKKYMGPVVAETVNAALASALGPMQEEKARESYWSQDANKLEPPAVVDAVEKLVAERRRIGQEISREQAHGEVVRKLRQYDLTQGQPAALTHSAVNQVARTVPGSTPAPIQEKQAEQKSISEMSSAELHEFLKNGGGYSDIASE